MLKLPQQLLTQVEDHGVRVFPFMGCGLLLGRVESGDNIVAEIEPAENSWPVEEEKTIRFRIDSDAWRQAELKAMAKNLDVIGIFYSQTDFEPFPSELTLAWASWPGYSYLITEFRRGQPIKTRSWQLSNDRSRFVVERIEIEYVEVGSTRGSSTASITSASWQKNPAVLIYQVLATRFSEEELRTLCFILDIDYEDLGTRGKSNNARELVAYCKRRNRLSDLVETIRQGRPDIDWSEVEDNLRI